MKHLPLAILGLLLAGCVRSEVTPINDTQYAAKPSGCSIRVFPKTKPDVAYEDIADARAKCHFTMGRSACIEKLKEDACEAGGDFIYGFAEGVNGEYTLISATIARRTGSAPSAEASSSSQASSGTEAGSSPARTTPNKQSAPTGAAGFMFGDTAGEAAKTCKDAGFEWKASGENRMTCSGLPVSGGLSGEALVRFCDKEVCSIQLTTADHKDSGKAWMEQYNAIQQALIRKYGAVHDNKLRVPQECMADTFATCVEEKKANVASFWKWDSGERVSIQLGAPAGKESLAIRIAYTRQLKTAENSGSGERKPAPGISTEGL